MGWSTLENHWNDLRIIFNSLFPGAGQIGLQEPPQRNSVPKYSNLQYFRGHSSFGTVTATVSCGSRGTQSCQKRAGSDNKWCQRYIFNSFEKQHLHLYFKWAAKICEIQSFYIFWTKGHWLPYSQNKLWVISKLTSIKKENRLSFIFLFKQNIWTIISKITY